MKINCLIFALTFFLSVWSRADQTVYVTAQIRNNVTAAVKVEILNNPNLPSGGRTVLIQHGLAHTGNAAKPLAEKMFADPNLSARISNIVLVNLPGRNGSSLPQGIHFGALSMIDFANTFLSVLNGLNDQGIHVDSIVAHSMGAVIVELAQNKLVSQGQDLKSTYNIDNVVLMASSIPRGLPWLIADSGLSTLLAVPNIRSNSTLGTYIDIPTLLWQNLWFTTRLYVVYSPTTPSLSAIDDLGYRSIEAYRASAELIGVIGFQRPLVNPNIFSANTTGLNFRHVAFSEDRNSSVDEERNLYRLLTGDVSDQNYLVVTRPDAVHDMFVSSPKALIDAGVFAGF